MELQVYAFCLMENQFSYPRSPSVMPETESTPVIFFRCPRLNQAQGQLPAFHKIFDL